MKTLKRFLPKIIRFMAFLIIVVLFGMVEPNIGALPEQTCSAKREVLSLTPTSPSGIPTYHECFENTPDDASFPYNYASAGTILELDEQFHVEGDASWKCLPNANFGYCYARIDIIPHSDSFMVDAITAVDVSFRISHAVNSNPSIDLVLGKSTEPDADRDPPFTDWLDISIFNISDMVTTLTLECGENACDQYVWKSEELADPPVTAWYHLRIEVEDNFDGNDVIKVYLKDGPNAPILTEPTLTAEVQLLDKFDTVHLYATNDNSINPVPMWWDHIAIEYRGDEFKRIYQSISDEDTDEDTALTGFLPEADELNSDWGHDWEATVHKNDGDDDPKIPQQILRLVHPSETYWTDPYTNTGIYGSGDVMSYTGELWWTSTHQDCSSGDPNVWASQCIKKIAYEYPHLWWLLGEAENRWVKHEDQPAEGVTCEFDGHACTFEGDDGPYVSPESFSHWIKTVADDIHAGWHARGTALGDLGKIVGFNFADPNVSQDGLQPMIPADYLDRFKTEWNKGNGLSGGWGNVPIDGIDYSFYADSLVYGEGDTPLQKAKEYWEESYGEWRDRPWLTGKFMWGETRQPKSRSKYEEDSSFQKVFMGETLIDQQAIQCDVANYLANLIEWGEQRDNSWFGGLRWSATSVPTGVLDADYKYSDGTYPWQRDENVPYSWGYYGSLYDTDVYAGGGVGLIPQEGDPLTAVGLTFNTGRPSYPCRRANLQVWKDFQDNSLELWEFESHIADQPPGIEDYLLALRSARNPGEVYGQRIQAFLHPPETGDYTFWITARDEGSLSLSTTSGHLENPNYATEIASVKTQNCSGGTDPFDWDSCSSQQSASVHLEADTKYYIEVLHAAPRLDEDNHVAVAWQIPGEERDIVAGDYLSPFGYQDAWRFRGYTYLGEQGDPPVGLPGALVKLYGYESGDAPPGNIVGTTISDNSGFWNFTLPEVPYDYYRILVEPPDDTILTDTWSETGTVFESGEIEWFQPAMEEHLNAFYFDATSTVHVYQQGVLGYYGVQDTDLDAWEPDIIHSTTPALRLRTTHDNNPPPLDQEVHSPIISFSEVDTSTAQQATLSMYVTGQSNTGDLFAHAAGVLQPVDVADATWNRYDGINSWQLAGARAEGVDRTGSIGVHSIEDVSEGNLRLDYDVTSLVQQGITDFVVYARHNWVNVQKNIASSEYWDTLKRPRLTLYDEAPPPLIDDVYQQGVSGYTGGEDTYINAWSPNDNNVYWRQYLRLRTTGSANPIDQEVRSPLIRFTGIGYQDFESATLSVYVYAQGGGACHLQAYVAGVNQPFAVQQATWNHYDTGAAWDLAGARSAIDRTASVDDQNVPDVSSGGVWIDFDVTPLVEQGEYDFMLYARHTSCNTGKLLASHEYWDVTKRPKLTVAHY